MEIFRPFLTFAKTSSNVPEYLSETESTEALNVNDNNKNNKCIYLAPGYYRQTAYYILHYTLNTY